MDRRGGTSLAIFLVLNPILILFYQNCSVLPSHTTRAEATQPAFYRMISSESDKSDQCRYVSAKTCAE